MIERRGLQHKKSLTFNGQALFFAFANYPFKVSALLELLASVLEAVSYRVREDCLFFCLQILCPAAYLASLAALSMTYNLFLIVNNRAKETNYYCRKLLM